MPAYNAEITIRRAIDSVLAQSTADWELIVVDDGSVDNTVAIVTEMGLQDPRIQVLRQAHGGTASARNCGIRATRGAWVALLDADDELCSQYVTSLLQLAARKPGYSAYCCNALRKYPDGQLRPVFREWLSSRVREVTLGDLIKNPRLLSFALVDREAFERVSGYRESVYAEDYDLWLRILAAGGSILYTPETLAVYTDSLTSKSADRPREIASLISILNDLQPSIDSDPSLVAVLVRRRARLEAAESLARVNVRAIGGDTVGLRSALLRYGRAYGCFKRAVAIAVALVSPRLYGLLVSGRLLRGVRW